MSWLRLHYAETTLVTRIAPLGDELSPKSGPDKPHEHGSFAGEGTSALDNVVHPVRVSIEVNGTAHELELDPRRSLLDMLREDLRLTGTKKGCNQGACGACTILLNGKRVLSCLTLAAMHDEAEIETIEGLERDGELHLLQKAFIERDGLQCGFCTAGQIMSGLGCIAEGHANSAQEIQFWMSGNICRCGAYPGIIAAISDVAEGK